jgi:hypothetical protein
MWINRAAYKRKRNTDKVPPWMKQTPVHLHVLVIYRLLIRTTEMRIDIYIYIYKKQLQREFPAKMNPHFRNSNVKKIEQNPIEKNLL